MHAGRSEEGDRTPCLFGLAPCGVYHAASITRGPVRSYRTLSPLPSLFREKAVCFLLHWPSFRLDAEIPDVIRHTALRSSDFPPPANTSPRRDQPNRQRSPSRLQVQSTATGNKQQLYRRGRQGKARKGRQLRRRTLCELRVDLALRPLRSSLCRCLFYFRANTTRSVAATIAGPSPASSAGSRTSSDTS